MAQLGHRASKMGHTLTEVMSWPELDEYTYSNGKSMVCSNFVAGIWKHAGLFGDLNIQAGEFQPFDIYRIDLFDHDPKNKKASAYCQRDTPDLPYC